MIKKPVPSDSTCTYVQPRRSLLVPKIGLANIPTTKSNFANKFEEIINLQKRFKNNENRLHNLPLQSLVLGPEHTRHSTHSVEIKIKALSKVNGSKCFLLLNISSLQIEVHAME